MTENTAAQMSLLRRLANVPRRFTAAFVLSILLFLWVSLAGGTFGYGFACQKECPVFEKDLKNVPAAIAFVERVGYAFTCGGIINGDGDTGGRPHLPLGTICVEQESSIGPADILEWSDVGAYSPAEIAIELGFALFLVAQMALAFAFAALKERGVKVSTRRRLQFHIFLPLGFAGGFGFPLSVSGILGYPTMVVLWPLWILISAAILVITRLIVDRKAPSSASSRTLRQAFLAMLPAIVFWFIRNAILPFSEHSSLINFCEIALALIYFFLFTAGFAWLFMAGIPDAPHKTEPVQESPND